MNLRYLFAASICLSNFVGITNAETNNYPQTTPIVFEDFNSPSSGQQTVLAFRYGSKVDNLSIDHPQTIQPTGNIAYASLALYEQVAFHFRGFPGKSNVIVAVIDPGVGDPKATGHDRSIIVIGNKEKGLVYLVAPDNGLLGLIKEFAEVNDIPIKAFNIDVQTVKENHPFGKGATFDGRDTFGLVGGQIYNDPSIIQEISTEKESIKSNLFAETQSILDIESKEWNDIVLLQDSTFGNIKTNIGISHSDLQALISNNYQLQLQIGRKIHTMPFKEFFAQVPKGKMLAYMGSTYHFRMQSSTENPIQMLELAVNHGSMAKALNVKNDFKSAKYRLIPPKRLKKKYNESTSKVTFFRPK